MGGGDEADNIYLLTLSDHLEVHLLLATNCAETEDEKYKTKYAFAMVNRSQPVTEEMTIKYKKELDMIFSDPVYYYILLRIPRVSNTGHTETFLVKDRNGNEIITNNLRKTVTELNSRYPGLNINSDRLREVSRRKLIGNGIGKPMISRMSHKGYRCIRLDKDWHSKDYWTEEEVIEFGPTKTRRVLADESQYSLMNVDA